VEEIKMMKNLPLYLIMTIALMSCQRGNVTFSASQSSSPSQKTEIVQNQVSSTNQSLTISENHLISNQGIGLAQLGMTFKQLKEKLGTSAKFEVISPFLVDFDAIAISQAGEVQYHIIYPSDTTFADSDVIELLFTDNPNYRTAEGVGVGTTLQQAQAIYGEATLSYNTQSESREMVRFANYPSKNIIFMPQRNSDDFAGIYSPSSAETEYHETNKFNDSATIGSVFVSL
jgi:hypothetical protein